MVRNPFHIFIGLTMLSLAAAQAQDDATLALTGNPTTDVLYSDPFIVGSTETASSPMQVVGARRSVALAGVLSIAVPGAGQVYNRNWFKAVALAGIEGAIVATYFTWRDRGREGERAFQAYAHAYWSPIRYARWLSGYSGYGGPEIPLPSLGEADFQQPEQWTDAQRREVDAFFRDIRAAESQSIHVETGAAFSHVLPFFAEQQYYELIGKYFQYAPGWDDYNGADDPEETGPDGEKVNVPRDSRFFTYAADHADANTWFRRASRLSGVIVLNHFLSAIDAAVSAKLHNDRLSTRVALVDGVDGLTPVAGLSLRF